MWPRFKLTQEESKYCSKYEGETGKQHVLRRIYYGVLNLTSTIRLDTETFQIARRARLFALTASGDVNLVEVQITDITGEQFNTDFTPLSDLLCGTNWDPRSTGFYNSGIQSSVGLATSAFLVGGRTYTPFVMEPAIVLAPNQTVSIQGRMIDPERQGPAHVSMTFHAWEFPGMPGSPV